MHMAVCGDVLTAGGTAVMTLEGAPASSQVFFAIGTTSAPTPFKGGMLVPVPVLLVVSIVSDANGALSIPVSGGGGPASVVIQAVAPDGSQPFGFALSNAIQFDFLP